MAELGGQYHKSCWTCEACHKLLDQYMVVHNKASAHKHTRTEHNHDGEWEHDKGWVDARERGELGRTIYVTKHKVVVLDLRGPVNNKVSSIARTCTRTHRERASLKGVGGWVCVRLVRCYL